MSQAAALQPPSRILLGPGPSLVHPRVLRAMSTPLVGHLDPAYLGLMDETGNLLRRTFRTSNRLTLPISATGSAGMEACFVNLLEPGDDAVICVNGVFGTRMVDIVGRCGANAIVVEAPWGRVIEAEAVERALKSCRAPKLIAIVHAETSTGVWQPLEEIGRLAHASGALFLVDAVTSLGGCPLEIDGWEIDACYSGTQKCLSCPPGLSPITLNERALTVLRNRRSKVQSWYLDLTMIEKYWGAERVYHHTAPISMSYALYEALRIVDEEGLEGRWERHRRNHEALKAGLAAMGLPLAAQEGHQLWTLNAVAIPDGIDDVSIRTALLNEFDIEIGGGLGPLKGKIWRIGLMGESSRPQYVLLVLHALEQLLRRAGHRCEPGSGLAGAERVYAA